MSIPGFQTLLLPALRLSSDGQEHASRDLVEVLADAYQLTADERAQLLPSGLELLFNNRVHWALTYLRQARLLETTRRGFVRITPRGQDLLAEDLTQLDVRSLRRFPEFVAFLTGPRRLHNGQTNVHETEELIDATATLQRTPEELLEEGYEAMRRALTDDLLTRVRACSPAFFERLVVELLVQMGYGGSRQDAGEAIGRSGDEGIDGIIKEDVLGLDIIYVQAKRWAETVGRPEIQRFAGALQGRRARKGIFLTTSTFTREAYDYVAQIESKIVLIDGRRLTELMIDHDVGVAVVSTYQVKRADSDYFTES
jgi:restriction system protein